MRCCATCDLVEINSVPACTDLPLWLCPLWPQRQGYSLQNMWLADCVTQPKVGGCIHGAVTSSKQCCFGEGSFCLEGVRLFGLILWKCAPHRGEEGRKGHIHQPPLCYGSPGPLFSLPLSLITEVSAEGDSRGELFPCKFTLLPPENTGKTAERHEREAAKAHFELFVMLPYSV